jgi:hypothetical protein
MGATSYAATNTRPNWGGSDADLDIHIEAYEGDIDGSFRVESLFRSSSLTNFKSVSDKSNTWRGDRVGGVVVKGRKSGVALDSQRQVNEKFLITVDTTSYIRTTVDYQDDWTAPDFQSETSAEHGSSHAKSFDQAHIIQLIKCGSWVAPAALKASGAFYDGIVKTATGYAAATDAEAKADLLVQAHKNALADFVKRDLGGSLSEFVTLIAPDAFNVLLDHKKLMNVDFAGSDAGAGNNFVMRRVAWLNGVRVIETPRFPTAAITDHILGPGFNVTAAEAKALMVVFHPRKTLVTVEAKPMTVRFWDDEKEFNNVLDSYTMYTVGIKRGDAVAVINSD